VTCQGTQGVLPERAFQWLWRARVRAMLRHRERHVCKLQTVSALMVSLSAHGMWHVAGVCEMLNMH